MMRFAIRAFAVAFGAMASVGIASAADDPAQKLGRYTPTSQTTAGSSSSNATDDTDLVHNYRRGYSYGYGGGYSRGYNSYSYGYGNYGGYRPSYSSSYYYNTPSYYAPSYYYTPRYYAPPVYYTPSYYYAPSYYSGGFCPIGGLAANTALTLSLALRMNEPVQPITRPIVTSSPARRQILRMNEPVQPITRNDPLNRERAIPSPFAEPQPGTNNPGGTFRYDGGPSNPVPQPKAEPMPPPAPLAPTPKDDNVKISFKGKPVKATNPYAYYGEKR